MMGRKKLDFNCKYCDQNTEVMEKPIYSGVLKGHFCNFDCYNLKLAEIEKKNEIGN